MSLPDGRLFLSTDDAQGNTVVSVWSFNGVGDDQNRQISLTVDMTARFGGNRTKYGHRPLGILHLT